MARLPLALGGLVLLTALAGCAGTSASLTPTPKDYDLIPLSRLTCDDWLDGMTMRERVDAAQILLGIVLARDGFDLNPNRESAEWFEGLLADECGSDPAQGREIEPLREELWQRVRDEYEATS